MNLPQEIKIKDTIFGYNILVKDGDSIISIKGEDVPELSLGMMVVLSGDSRGYVPSNFKPEEEVSIIEFTEPFVKGSSDHIVKVSAGDRSGWIKPSNIQRILPKSGPSSFASNAPASSSKKFDVLNRGSSGKKVKEIQTALKQIGVFNSAIDGNYGRLTEVAVRDFQKDHGYSQTGEVDESTYNEILKSEPSSFASNAPASSSKKFDIVRVGSTGEKVTEIQIALKQIGVFNKATDGIFGRNTEAAVRNFQKDQGYAETGEVDESTYNEILKIASDNNDYVSSSAQFQSNARPDSANKKTDLKNQEDEPFKISAAEIDDAIGKATQFISEFEDLKSEYSVWYRDAIDANDGELSALLEAVKEHAGNILKNKEKYYTNETIDGTQLLIIADSHDLRDSILRVVSKCDDLNSHYHSKLKDEELTESLRILNIFKNMAQRFADEIVHLIPSLKNFVPLSADPTTTANPKNIPNQLVINAETLTALNSDVPDADAPDSLGITPDVNALASVIAYKDLKTPLAIGLFGNWGSGKSFFMKKLQKQINVFAADVGNDYVERVVHIEFNSWHYSDSNLWASFVTKIFEDLDTYGQSHPNAVKDIFKKLNDNSEFLAEAKANLAGIQSTITKLEKELTTKKAEISVKSKELSKAKLYRIGVSIFNNKQVKKKLGEAKKLLPQKELNNLDDISRSVKELSTFVGRFKETINLLFSFNSKQSLIALSLFVILCASPWWLPTFFAVDIQKFFGWFGQYSKFAATVFAAAAGIATYATTILSRVNEKLKSALATSVEMEKEVLIKHQSEVDKMQSELDMQQQAHIQKESEINKLKKEQAETQAAIDDIQSGKKLASFISNKVNDQRYVGSLGIISWIRKDFKKLDEILKEQRLLNNLKQKSLEEKAKIFQVDRIVLYIDDLDRCKEDIVVRVLEAIHLLLAFELFVVVVGVDPRWMHNALNNNYKRQLKINKGDNEKNKINVEVKKDNNKINVEINEEESILNSATSYDYLEKIFQVPFALNEIEPKGKAQLIDELTKVLKKETKSDVTPASLSSVKNSDSEKNKTVDEGLNNANAASFTDEQKKAEEKRKQIEEEVKKTEEDKRQKEEVKKAKEQLVILPDEIKFMKDISELIGNSPRTINRYINIYRIIRSHAKLEISDTPIQDYCAVMVLLGIITGLPNESEEFYKRFAEQNSGTFESLVSRSGDEFKALKFASKVPFKISDTEHRTVGDLTIEFMKKRFELVQRFSFRNYAETETPEVSFQIRKTPATNLIKSNGKAKAKKNPIS